MTADLWEIADHVCAGCQGRILRRLRDDAVWVYRCADCGMMGIGESRRGRPTICACSYRVGHKDGPRGSPGREAGFRCVANPAPTPDDPAEIVVREG